MSPASLSITFHLEIFGRHVTLARDAAASETLETVSLKLLRSTGIGDSLEGWEILREEGEPLSFEQQVGELVRDRWSGSISVTLRLTMQLPGRPAPTTESKEDLGGGPRLPKQRPGAPITRHEIRLPNVNEVKAGGDGDTDLEEGPSTPAAYKAETNGKGVAATAAKPASKPMMTPPKPAAKPASKPMMAPPKPGAAPAAGTPAAKPASKPMMAPPKPGAAAGNAPAAKPPSKPMMAPPKPAASAPAAKPPSKPMMAPPKPAKPPSKPMMAPPAPAAPPAAARSAPTEGSKPAPGVVDTDFDIPPMQEPGSSVVAVNQVKEETRKRSLERDDTAAEIYLSGSDATDATVVSEEEVDYEESASMAEARASRKKRSAGAAPRTAERRATVRYYNRMNPQRVFPMLVVISKQMIERAAQAQADQKTTGPFAVNLDSAIEIEPVLPGCYCYPPKATARVGGDDVTFTFHVVPHVLGEVTGACIHVRQDHFDLAKLDLDIKVVQRTWALLTGALAIGLPFVTALARHFHFDLGTQKDVFLVAMDAVVNNVPPLALMGGFAVLTLLVYGLTRARRTDEFFDVTPIGPDEKLKQISERLASDPSATTDDLMYLLKAHPDHVEARLLLADCHFRRGNHADALSAYQTVFAKSKTEDRHYLQAARAAAKTGDWVSGSKILSAAEEALTRERTLQRDFEEVRQELRGAARQTM
jgi:tetratricopeptide repeat protein